MKKFVLLAATAASLAVSAAPASAQVSTTARDRIGQLLGAIFGGQLGTNGSIDSQWVAGQTPIGTQRYQFETRVDAEVRAGNLNQTTAQRLKADYYNLAQLEAQYGADRQFTAQERADLTQRYNALNQVLAAGGYADGGYNNGGYNNGTYNNGAYNNGVNGTTIASGRAEFENRLNAAVADRRITRAQATRLRTDFNSLVTLENSYQRDGVIDAREQQDLDARMDAIDTRIGDVGYGGTGALTTSARLDAILRALPYSGLSAASQTALGVQYEDLRRLDAAYARLNETADERAYLESRLVTLETQARVRR